MTTRASLKLVSTTVLEHLREAVASGLLKPPVDRAVLARFGVRHQIEAIESALAGQERGMPFDTRRHTR